MPYDTPTPTDPHMPFEALPPRGPEKMRKMAEAFADEFSRIGYSAPRILALFENPFFSGYAALLALGEPAIRKIVVKAALKWPAVRILDAPAQKY